MAFLFPDKIHARLSIALVLTAILWPVAARADGAKVYLWGFQHDCKNIADTDHSIEKDLFAKRGDIGLLTSPAGQPLPPCTPGNEERCVQSLRAVCPMTQGRILGGQIVTEQDTLNTRLWLYDLASGQIAYQDDYCQGCTEADALAAQIQRILDQPHFAARPGAKPMYCAAGAGSALTPIVSPQPPRPVFLSVFGEGKHRAALTAILKQQLGTRARQVLPMPFEPRSYGPEDLQKIVAERQEAQVLGAESRKDGKVYLFVYDGRTKRIADNLLDCDDCSRDRDALATRVQNGVTTLLDRCFSLQCGDPNMRPPGTEPPVEACQPFPEAACALSDKLMIPAGSAAAINTSGYVIDPSTASLAKGLTWGAFAVTAATAGLLFAVNGAVTTDSNRYVLTPTAWAMTGAAAVSLACATPLTLRIRRAEKQSSQSTLPASGNQWVQCPRP